MSRIILVPGLEKRLNRFSFLASNFSFPLNQWARDQASYQPTKQIKEQSKIFPGQQNLRATCSKGKLEFNSFFFQPSSRKLSECAFSFISQVYFWKAPSGQIPPPQSEFKATIDTSTTLHLQAYTSYRFQVVAYNSVSDGPASNVVGPLTTPESSKCQL